MRREKNVHVFFSLIEFTTPDCLKNWKKLVTLLRFNEKISIRALNDRQIILYILNKKILMRREQ